MTERLTNSYLLPNKRNENPFQDKIMYYNRKTNIYDNKEETSKYLSQDENYTIRKENDFDGFCVDSGATRVVEKQNMLQNGK